MENIDFRKIMGQFATGVTVITTKNGDQLHGSTANAVSSVSLDPMINDIPNLEINRLKPLEIVQKNGYAYITCTGGEWDNNGEYINSNYVVECYSEPLHICASLTYDILIGNDNKIHLSSKTNYTNQQHLS